MSEHVNSAVGSQVACEMSRAPSVLRERSATMLETSVTPRGSSPMTFICFLITNGRRGSVRRVKERERRVRKSPKL